jgi:hypothetical protein
LPTSLTPVDQTPIGGDLVMVNEQKEIASPRENFSASVGGEKKDNSMTRISVGSNTKITDLNAS